jgi:hypothetical protein
MVIHSPPLREVEGGGRTPAQGGGRSEKQAGGEAVKWRGWSLPRRQMELEGEAGLPRGQRASSADGGGGCARACRCKTANIGPRGHDLRLCPHK